MHITEDLIDPELRSRARMMRFVMKPARSEATLRKRSRIEGLTRRLMRPRGLRVADRYAERPDGTRLRLLVCQPHEVDRTRTDAPGLLWIHGGGYVMGTPEQDGSTIRRLIGVTGAVVVAPAYRLGPEAPYPAALDDCYLALRWMRDHAAELGIREDQLAVAGNSAGGGLTAAVTLLARDRGEIAVAFQMPLYPMLDDRCATPSAAENDAPVWDSITNRNAWKVYLGELSGTDAVPVYAAAARASDLHGLPPTMTYVGAIEPFRDEVVAYVEGLRAAGVPVAFEEFAGAYHGFDVVAPGATISRRALAFQDAWLREAVDRWFAPQPAR